MVQFIHTFALDGAGAALLMAGLSEKKRKYALAAAGVLVLAFNYVNDAKIFPGVH